MNVLFENQEADIYIYNASGFTLYNKQYMSVIAGYKDLDIFGNVKEVKPECETFWYGHYNITSCSTHV